MGEDKDATIARLTAELQDAEDRANKFAAKEMHTEKRAEQAEAKLAEVTAERDQLHSAIKRQAGAAKTLRESTLAEVQHLRDLDRSEYVAHKTLDSEREANSRLTEEVERLTAERDAARDEGFAQGIEAAAEIYKRLTTADEYYSTNDILLNIRALSPTPPVDVKETPAHDLQAGLTLTDNTQATQADPVREAARMMMPGAIEALSAYQQADMDGIMVLVSRQAIEECLPVLRALAQKGE